MTSVGIVVIGRNEGERLGRCLASVQAAGVPCVYVDSGSSDGSAQLARACMEHVVVLDGSKPYSAARGRNAGFGYLLSNWPGLLYVQFVDGDCELDARWIERASDELAARPRVAIVCGQLREAQPEASVYNTLCEIEWSRPAGMTPSCGGIFMVRVDAFNAVGGFDESIVAGEEPELCRRLRREGWSILRISAPMAVHDAAMDRFGQWWSRAVRSGRCVMENLLRPSTRGDGGNIRRLFSILLWAVVIPMAGFAGAWLTGGLSLLLLLAYPIQWCRLWLGFRRKLGLTRHASSIGATFTLIGKFAELVGLAQGCWLALRSKARTRAWNKQELQMQAER